MTKQAYQIGFSQRVRLEWFEHTTNLILAGNDKASVNDALQERLKDTVSIGGHSKGSNRNKIISILRKIWVTTPKEMVPLRDDGLAFLSTDRSSPSPHHMHLAIYWGMTMAVYPFWAGVAMQVGRLLKLQGSVLPTRFSDDCGSSTVNGRRFPERLDVCFDPMWTGTCFRKQAPRGFTVPG